MPRQKNLPVRIIKTPVGDTSCNVMCVSSTGIQENGALVPTQRINSSAYSPIRPLLLSSPFSQSNFRNVSLLTQQNQPYRVHPVGAPDMRTFFSQVDQTLNPSLGTEDPRRLLMAPPRFPFVAPANVRDIPDALTQSTSVSQERSAVVTLANRALGHPNSPNTRATSVAPQQRQLLGTSSNVQKQSHARVTKQCGSYDATRETCVTSTQVSNSSGTSKVDETRAVWRPSSNWVNVKDVQQTREEHARKYFASMNVQRARAMSTKLTNPPAAIASNGLESRPFQTHSDYSVSPGDMLQVRELQMRTGTFFGRPPAQDSHSVMTQQKNNYARTNVNVSQFPVCSADQASASANNRNALKILPQLLNHSSDSSVYGQNLQRALPAQFDNAVSSPVSAKNMHRVHHLPLISGSPSAQVNHISHTPEIIPAPFHKAHIRSTPQELHQLRLQSLNQMSHCANAREMNGISSTPFVHMSRTSDDPDIPPTQPKAPLSGNNSQMHGSPGTSFSHLPSSTTVREVISSTVPAGYTSGSVTCQGKNDVPSIPYSHASQFVDFGKSKEHFSAYSGGDGSAKGDQGISDAPTQVPSLSVINGEINGQILPHLNPTARKLQDGNGTSQVVDMNNILDTSVHKSELEAVLHKPPEIGHTLNVPRFPDRHSEPATDLGYIPGLYTCGSNVCSSFRGDLRNVKLHEVSTVKMNNMPDATSVKSACTSSKVVPESSASDQDVTLYSPRHIQDINKVPATAISQHDLSVPKVIGVSTPVKCESSAQVSKTGPKTGTIASNIIKYVPAQEISQGQNAITNISEDMCGSNLKDPSKNSQNTNSTTVSSAAHTPRSSIVSQNLMQPTKTDHADKEKQIYIASSASTGVQNMSSTTNNTPDSSINIASSQCIENEHCPSSNILNKILSNPDESHHSSSTGPSQNSLYDQHLPCGTPVKKTANHAPPHSVRKAKKDNQKSFFPDSYGSCSSANTENATTLLQVKNLPSSTSSLSDPHQKFGPQLKCDTPSSIFTQGGGSVINEPHIPAAHTPKQAHTTPSQADELLSMKSQSSPKQAHTSPGFPVPVQQSAASVNDQGVRTIMTRSRSAALQRELQKRNNPAPPASKRRKCDNSAVDCVGNQGGVCVMTRRRWAAQVIYERQVQVQELLATEVELKHVDEPTVDESTALCVQTVLQDDSALHMQRIVQSQQEVDMSGSLKMRISLTHQRIVSVGCAPNLKGRPRRKRKKRSISPGGSESNESESSLSTVSSSVKGKQLQLQSSQQNEPQPSCSKRVTLAPPRRNNSLVQSRKSSRVTVSQEEKDFLAKLHAFMKTRRTPIQRVPHLGFKEIDLYAFYTKVQKLGGYNAVTSNRLWKTIYDELGGHQGSTSAATYTRRHYERLLLPYERSIRAEKPVSRNHMKLKEDKKQGTVRSNNQASTSKSNSVVPAAKSSTMASSSKSSASSSAKSSTPSSAKQTTESKETASAEMSKEKTADPESKSSSLRSVRAKSDKSQELSSAAPATPGKENIPVSNVTEEKMEVKGEPSSQSVSKQNVSKDKTAPEVIDLAVEDSPVKIGKATVPTVKKRKLDILKEGGLEVTAITSPPAVAERRPSVIQHAAPIQASDSQVSITVTPDVSHILGSPATDLASTPSPSLSYDSPTQQQAVNNGQDYNKAIAIYTSPEARSRPSSRSGGWTPPRVVQSSSMYARSESTVYGNPKENIDGPCQLLQPLGHPKPTALFRDEVLDLRVKCVQKPVVTLSRVTNNMSMQGPSRNVPRTLPKPSNGNTSFPTIGGRTVIGTLGSNLEITVVDVPKTVANSSHRNHQLPQSSQQHHPLKHSQVQQRPSSSLSNKLNSNRLSGRNENGKYHYSYNNQPIHRNNTAATNGSNSSLAIPSLYPASSSNGRSGARLQQLPSTSVPNNVVPPFLSGGSSSLFPGYLPPTASGNGAKPPYLPMLDPLYYASLYNSHVYPPALTAPGFVPPPMFGPSPEQLQLYKDLMNQHHSNMRFPQQNNSVTSYLGLPRDGSTSITPVSHSTNPTSK